ncbi:MAG TPA: hypothetical protein VN797_03195 [Gemmatimonadaceae bacterium]|nr:hypothetical protein [Gemmatimonadaceae bacterium]
MEQYTALAPCELIQEPDGTVMIELSSGSEFVREMSSSVTLGYKCGAEECPFYIEARSLSDVPR